MQYVMFLAATVLGCLGMQSYSLQSLGGQTVKSESNFFSSVARVQNGLRGTPNIYLLGSSLTGRLPDRSMGFTGVANLGCDGASAVDLLRPIIKGEFPAPPVIIVEGNTIYRALSPGMSEVAKELDSPWFRIGVKIRNLGATARPSAFLYSYLMGRRYARTGSEEIDYVKPSNKPAIPDGIPQDLQSDEQALISELSAGLSKLHDKGTKVFVVILPQGGPDGAINRRLPMALASSAGVPFWDLSRAIDATQLRFTDGLHMDNQSSAHVMDLLLSAI